MSLTKVLSLLPVFLVFWSAIMVTETSYSIVTIVLFILDI